jgi:hypothetical protein
MSRIAGKMEEAVSGGVIMCVCVCVCVCVRVYSCVFRARAGANHRRTVLEQIISHMLARKHEKTFDNLH